MTVKEKPPHVKVTKQGFTHWSSGPGNLTFDPDCPRCLMDEKKTKRRSKRRT
jgi:hypothetical protein